MTDAQEDESLSGLRARIQELEHDLQGASNVITLQQARIRKLKEQLMEQRRGADDITGPTGRTPRSDIPLQNIRPKEDK